MKVTWPLGAPWRSLWLHRGLSTYRMWVGVPESCPIFSRVLDVYRRGLPGLWGPIHGHCVGPGKVPSATVTLGTQVKSNLATLAV